MNLKLTTIDLWISSLFVTLPFISLNLWGNLSATDITAAIFTIVFLSRVFLGQSFVFNRLDSWILWYLMLGIISVIANSDIAPTALFKSIYYGVFYLCFKNYIYKIKRPHLIRSIQWGLIVGLSLFVLLLFIYGAFNILNLLNPTYENVFLTPLRQLNESLLGNYDIESKDLLRNVTAEGFLLSSSLLLFSPWRASKLYSLLAFCLTLITYSQRAYVAAGLIALTTIAIFIKGSRNKYERIVIKLGLPIMALGVILYIIASRYNLGELGLLSRWEQYGHVLEKSNLLIGDGYGAKFVINQKEAYIHNFFLAALYMTGAMGLVLSVLIYLQLFYMFVRSLTKANYASTLLILALTSLLVSGTVEGILSINSWLALGLFYRLNSFRIEHTRVPSKVCPLSEASCHNSRLLSAKRDIDHI